MSKQHRLFYLTIVSATWILQIFTQASAQDVTATIKLDKRLPEAVEITGRFTDSGLKKRGRNLSFVLDHAGIQGLGARIGDIRLFDGGGRLVANRKMIDGEYLAEGDFSAFVYTVSVQRNKRPSAAAHVSWVSDDSGVLMLGDLIPRVAGDSKISAKVNLSLPQGWEVHSSSALVDENNFVVADVVKAVFFIGNGWRNVPVDGAPISFAIYGERHYSDAEAVQMVREIYADYRKMFDRDPASKIQISIGSLPNTGRPGEWYAETRGTTVTIVSTDMAFKTQSLQRLHEQLRHEIFHLWLPNGIDLKGNYDWFYEGFALYASLKTGVRLNRIRFEDLLDTLSRAHRFDDAIPPKESLIDASENRWAGGNDRVYARGMLVAFLSDIALLQRSNGKRSVEDVIGRIYRDHQNGASEDANAAVLRSLRSYPELLPTIGRYITGKERIEWGNELRVVGLESAPSGLVVTPKPTGSQRAMLDKLGYNNWRKLSRSSK